MKCGIAMARSHTEGGDPSRFSAIIIAGSYEASLDHTELDVVGEAAGAGFTVGGERVYAVGNTHKEVEVMR